MDIVYRSDDGEFFDTKEACIAYEKRFCRVLQNTYYNKHGEIISGNLLDVMNAIEDVSIIEVKNVLELQDIEDQTGRYMQNISKGFVFYSEDRDDWVSLNSYEVSIIKTAIKLQEKTIK